MDTENLSNSFRLTQVRRGMVNTPYAATLEVNGAAVGFVKKSRGTYAGDYYAVVDGEMVARGRTLEMLKDDVRDWLSCKVSD